MNRSAGCTQVLCLCLFLFAAAVGTQLACTPPASDPGAVLDSNPGTPTGDNSSDNSTGGNTNPMTTGSPAIRGRLALAGAATRPTPIPGLDNSQYRIDASDPRLATLSADHTYTLEIPPEVLPTTLHMNDSTTKTVSQYKIDITAECPSGNSAIMVYFAKP